jgi:SAM-dependent methyltransferase
LELLLRFYSSASPESSKTSRDDSPDPNPMAPTEQHQDTQTPPTAPSPPLLDRAESTRRWRAPELLIECHFGMAAFFETQYGSLVLADSLHYLAKQKKQSVDLIVTSPPFGLVRKKDYGNVESHEYLEWFKPFGKEFVRVLKPAGSLVIDIGGAWIPGQPTRSLYHFELAIMLCRELGFYLAQEFFWWNPSKLPTPIPAFKQCLT